MEKQRKKYKFLVTMTFITWVIYITWRIFFTIPYEYGALALGMGIILLVVEVIGMFEAGINFYTLSSIENPPVPEVDQSLFPDVDVFVPTYNEPVELLYKTINGCKNMEYPDRSKVHIYICDDSNRPEMKALAKHLGVGYITRLEREHAKAGNLNNALSVTDSPLVVTFDADMIPMHDFLMTCVPYFLTGEKIGFVQTPQAFYNLDLFQYNLYSENRIPNEQDYFYKDIQVSRNKTNSVIYGGSNTVLSRSALEEVGGFYTGVITEDFATGIVMQSKGYKCLAINSVHASGLAPSDLKSLIKQRERWARGCIQTGRKLNILFMKGLNFKQKMCYSASILYWYSGLKRLVYIISPIMFGAFNIVIVKCTLLEMLIFWLPMHLLMNRCLKLLSQNVRTVKWSNIYETILFPSLLPGVILETFGISQTKFSVTQKDGQGQDFNYQVKQAIPHIIFGIFTLIGIIKCTFNIFATGSMEQFIILYWLITNLYNITLSVFFMMGRKIYRKWERVVVQLPCTIEYKGRKIQARTKDISEEGLAVILDFPQYIPYDEPIHIYLQTELYEARFQVEIVHVTQFQEQWKYAMHISKIDEENYKKLLNIIYDREPTITKNLDDSVSSFEDIQLNIFKRLQTIYGSNRKLPRIPLKCEMHTIEGQKVMLTEFNYEYAVMELDKPLEAFNLIVEDQRYFEMIYHKEIEAQNCYLYYVKNYRDFIEDGSIEKLLKKWIDISKMTKQQEVECAKQKISQKEFDEMTLVE